MVGSFILIKSRKLRETKAQQIACAAGQSHPKLIAVNGKKFRLSRLSRQPSDRFHTWLELQRDSQASLGRRNSFAVPEIHQHEVVAALVIFEKRNGKLCEIGWNRSRE
jgi:hypothetical protein